MSKVVFRKTLKTKTVLYQGVGKGSTDNLCYFNTSSFISVTSIFELSVSHVRFYHLPRSKVGSHVIA